MKNLLSHWESGDAWRVVSLVALMFLCRTQPCVVKPIGRILSKYKSMIPFPLIKTILSFQWISLLYKLPNKTNHEENKKTITIKTDILQKCSLTNSRYDCYNTSPLLGLTDIISRGLLVSINKDDLNDINTLLFSFYSPLFFILNFYLFI